MHEDPQLRLTRLHAEVIAIEEERICKPLGIDRKTLEILPPHNRAEFTKSRLSKDEFEKWWFDFFVGRGLRRQE